MIPLHGARVLVLGLGETGLSIARFCERRGATHIRVADTRATPPGAAALAAALPRAELRTGAFEHASFEGIDLIAISPGVPKDQPLIDAARRRGVPLAGDIELFAQALAGRPPRPKVIAVTGTNGKTTVTSLAGALARAAGFDTEVAGNIGPAALDALLERERRGAMPAVWVLELSSFQLETVESLEPDAAAMLNLTEDHLDRYAGMAGYAAAKARIFAGQGLQVLNREDPASLAMRRPGRPVSTFGLDTPPGPADCGLVRQDGEFFLARGANRVCPVSALRLAGNHNVANALAALALAGVLGAPDAALARALCGFTGLPHRVQRIAEHDQITWYDDSKGTNVGATVAALAGLGAPLIERGARIVLIAGGDGKGQDFAPLAGPVQRYCRALVQIGRDGPRIAAAAGVGGVPVLRAESMEEAVRAARAVARAGDLVLLSPACASFDMFRNYAHRAEVYAAAVGGLAHA